MFDHKIWNRTFLDHLTKHGTVYNDATEYGVTIEHNKSLIVGDLYWRCIGVHHLECYENRGNHNVFVDVLSQSGFRIENALIMYHQDGQRPIAIRMSKPLSEFGADFPMHGAPQSTVSVLENSLKTDAVTGLRINHPDECEGNSIGHHSFYVVWQLTKFIGHIENEDKLHDSVTESKETATYPITTLHEVEQVALGKAYTVIFQHRLFINMAKRHHLGYALSAPYHFVPDGHVFYAQVFEKGLVYVKAEFMTTIACYRIIRRDFTLDY